MNTRPQRLSLLALGAFLLSAPLLCQWSAMSIEMDPAGSPYRCWHKVNNTRVDDVVYLDSPAGGFCDQVLSDPHVEYNASGDALLMGDGSSFQNAFGDAISMIVRRGSDGYFNTNPAPDPIAQASIVMHFPTPSNCAPPGYTCDWTWAGGLGGGGSFTHSPIKTKNGYEYFAVVEVSDYHGVRVGAPYDYDHGDKFDHCPNPPYSECGCAFNTVSNPAKAWFTWAVSQDGLVWSFASASGGTTTNPLNSVQLLSRSDGANVRYISAPADSPNCGTNLGLPKGTGGGWSARFGHPILFYDKYDNYFYMAFQWGWGSTLATKLTSMVWYRMQFDPYNAYGLGPVERLVDSSSPTPFVSAACTPFAVGCGRIPSDESWIPGATYPTGAAVPSDLTLLSNDVSTGFRPTYGPKNFDSILLNYSGDANHPFTFYRKGTQRTFPFFTAATQSLTSNYADLTDGLISSSCSAPPTPPPGSKAIAFTPATFGGYRTAVQQLV